MNVQLFDDAESLSHAAAQLVTERMQEAVRLHGRATLVLAGGETPRRSYELLTLPPFRDQLPWAQLDVFFGDERCVPPQDPLSNQRMARIALLDHVPVPWEQVHPISCIGDPLEAAREYELLLRNFFAGREPGFDLVLLGMGSNGHTASLFPGSDLLRERGRWVAELYVPEQQMFRVTLTIPALNLADTIAFLITGASKAETLKRVLEAPQPSNPLPAQMVRPRHGEPIWLVDREAGRLLISS